MQEPLLRPTPDPGDAQDQLPDQNMPNPWRSRGGCYPRWWILAAFFMASLTTIVMFLWNPLICPAQAGGTRLPICFVASWPALAQIPLLWLLFGVLGIASYILAVGFIEAPQREPSRLAEFIRSVSEFGPMHPLLLLQGFVALTLIIVLWWLDRTPAIVFALLSILVFVAHCSVFQRRPSRVRRYYLIGYGVLGLTGLVVALLLKRYLQTGSIPEGDQPLLASEFLLLVIGIIAIFRQPRPEQPLTAQEAWDQSVAEVATPLYAFRSLPGINRIWPNRPVQANNPNNPQNPGNPPAGGGP